MIQAASQRPSGQLIGSYRLVRQLGEGGMGEVWEAEQLAPVRRTVALKLLKAGMDTRQVLARFEAERQVLARMQHPAIAQVFDAGVTTVGRPYFVMEYVDGVRITRYCDEAQLGVSERLLLFQQVCDAVQHAHQKGVIHRDVKPSNVLVATRNGVPQPKVIDFGLAKLVASEAKDLTLTEVGTVLGTPAYASPEQMSFGMIDVDTRSDVYSLGVLLYELLLGVIPSGEHEPTRPSALRRELRGDLDWIVMKALEKDRAQRYTSPGELARDTQRYLEHEPVLASPPSAAYRMRKFVRRHRVGTAFGSVLAILVVAFAITSAIQVKRIGSERDRATNEAAKASSISKFLQDTLGSADPWQTGSDISVRETLKRAADKIDVSFKDQPLVAAAIHHTLGNTYIGLGRLDEAEREIRAALKTRIALLGHEHIDVAESLADLGDLYQARADFDAAVKANGEALDIRRRLLGDQHPLVARSLFDRAVMLRAKGDDFDAAQRASSEALAIREKVYGIISHEVAEVVQQQGLIAAMEEGDLVRGEQLVRRGYEIHRQLGTDEVLTAVAASNLASIYLYEGKYDQAEVSYRAAMQSELRLLGKSHPDTIVDMENLANVLARLERFDEASALMKDVLAGRRAVLGDDNKLVIRTQVNIAKQLSAAGKLTEAQAAFAQAVPKFTRAYGPEHRDTARVVYYYGLLRIKQHDYMEAERLLRQALAIQLKLFPDDHPVIADTRLNLGTALLERHQFAEAQMLLSRAREVMQKAYGPDSRETRSATEALDRLHSAAPSGT